MSIALTSSLNSFETETTTEIFSPFLVANIIILAFKFFFIKSDRFFNSF